MGKKTLKAAIVGMIFLTSGLSMYSCSEIATNSTDRSELLENVPVQPFNGSTQDVKNQNKADLNRELAELRRATASFHNIDKAKEAGYDIKLTPCWFHSELGAMGYHYGDVNLIDGNPELLKPEALIYEPGINGHLSLVALEYIIPIGAWGSEEKPSLLGEEFMRNDGLGLYTLHVWLWKHNPAGMFAGWNPNVSCKYAEDSEDRSAS